MALLGGATCAHRSIERGASLLLPAGVAGRIERMSIDLVDGCAMYHCALTPIPSATGAGEGSGEPRVEALYSDERSYTSEMFCLPLNACESRGYRGGFTE